MIAFLFSEAADSARAALFGYDILLVTFEEEAMVRTVNCDVVSG